MDHHHHHALGVVFMLVLLSLPHDCMPWNFFGSGKTESPFTESYSKAKAISGDVIAEFSMEALNDQKGIERVDKARRKLAGGGSNTCWQNAYESLFAGCSEIIPDDKKRRRFAWLLSDCFQKDSGGHAFPSCDTRSDSDVKKCLQKLDEEARSTYLAFFLETNSICHHLQADAFKRGTERLVNDLRKSAQFAEEKLENIEERSENLLQSSKEIHDSLTWIDLRTQQVARASKNVEDNIDTVLKHSEAVFEQSKGIAASQLELQEGQVKMKKKFEEGMAMIQGSYNNLGLEIDKLRNDAVEIENEISRVGNTMTLKMENLQSRADDIGEVAGQSLDKQKQLLDGQSTALEGLQFLTKSQSQALEESRATLQRLAEFGHKQQEELLQRQEILQQAHDHLVENSKSMLAAQEAFESKQASMFIALDKLFTLHNAMLLESRSIKAFFIYSLSIFILYMFTSTKQTYTVRPRLYIGLCATFLIEFAILRFSTYDIAQQTQIINMIRSIFAIVSSIQLLHAICTFRDYEVLNHQMLLTLMEKVNGMQRNIDYSACVMEDSDVDWSTWIDTDMPEDVDIVKDPDFILQEEIGENSITTTSITRKYNLRNRLRQ
ncbi:Protein gamete expressed 1 [Vitis vinifera]|uniref:Protein gamete expressed 1 n=1 Tax=Vitis vinifera TaxID=29760 RepID=A0A438DQ64_VITVI|nr:Protein gamete expressed 1 [Vitis vinifera]